MSNYSESWMHGYAVTMRVDFPIQRPRMRGKMHFSRFTPNATLMHHRDLSERGSPLSHAISGSTAFVTRLDTLRYRSTRRYRSRIMEEQRLVRPPWTICLGGSSPHKRA